MGDWGGVGRGLQAVARELTRTREVSAVSGSVAAALRRAAASSTDVLSVLRERDGQAPAPVDSTSTSTSTASTSDDAFPVSQQELSRKRRRTRIAASAEPESLLHGDVREKAVPASRVSRALEFSSLGVGLGVGALSSRLGLSSAPAGLSEAAMSRVVATLCRVRGAALKLGQVLSIQDESFLPRELQAVLERVRSSADIMPQKQLEAALRTELGPEWEQKFRHFNPRPFAAASIGQVHAATTLDGEYVAVKVQYPGVADSIDSDINNLRMIMSVTGLIPKGLYFDRVLDHLRKELKWETDYEREARCAKRFRRNLVGDLDVYVPRVVDDLSTKRVLTMELLPGVSVDHAELDQETRNWIGEKILGLCIRELFEFRFMQTDPNWSNFLYDQHNHTINLLDFGASHEYAEHFIDHYIQIIDAARKQDEERCLHHSTELGFLSGKENSDMVNAHVQSVFLLGKPFAEDGDFDFATQDVTGKVRKFIPVMLKNRLVPPPQEVYSLHRKLSGAFLLCSKLGAKFNAHRLFDRVYAAYGTPPEQWRLTGVAP